MNGYFFGWSARMLGRIHKSAAVVTVLAMVLMLAPAGFTFASVTETGVTLDGTPTATVLPGASVAAVLSVAITQNDDWESTSWDIVGDGNPATCVNTTNRSSSGNYTASFSITAPVTPGTYSITFSTFGTNGNNTNDNCTVDQFSPDAVQTFSNILVVQGPPGTLKVTKTVNNMHGGTAVASDFSFSVNGGSATAFEADTTNEISVAPGTYTVTEVGGPNGYSASYNNCANVTVSSGQTTTCTIINDDIAPTLTIVKQAAGGNDTFGFTVTDGNFTQTPSVSTSGGTGQTSIITLPTIGSYGVSETTIPTGWDINTVSCTVNGSASGTDIIDGKTITVDIGDEAVCTFNDTKRGSISVTKYAEPNGAFNFSLTSVNDPVTLGNGNAHTFENLVPGSFTLTETVPQGWTGSQEINCGNAGVGEGSVQLTLAPGENISCTANNTQDAVISGSKFEDADGTGSGTDGEKVSGWGIVLQTTDDETWSIADTAVTDEFGNFSFLVQPGTYRVCEAGQEGWTQSYPAEGSSCDYGIGYGITAKAGGTYATNYFGNYRLGTITGNKFYDADADGAWDTETEDGLSGWIIYIDANNNQQRDENEQYATTNTAGQYTITGVEPGTYLLREEIPSGENWVQTAPADGYYQVAVTSNKTAGSYNFGNIPGGTISGHKWNDKNGNANWDEGEGALADISIILYQVVDGEETAIASTTTDETGYYEFTKQAAGTYRVKESAGTHWRQTYPADSVAHDVVLAVGVEGIESSADNDFGNIAVVSLSGAKFEDVDHDGYWDGVHGYAEETEPGIEGWTIVATPIVEEGGDEDSESGRETKTTVTDEGGEYTFQFLDSESGWWRIAETAQDNWEQTYPATETGYYDVYISPDGPLPAAPDIFPPPGGPQVNAFIRMLAFVTGADVAHAGVITHEAGFDTQSGTYEYYDFGNWEYPTLHVLKWEDKNENGIRDTENETFTDPALQGYPIAVGRYDDAQEVGEGIVPIKIIASEPTNENGIAEFRLPVGGTYYVFESMRDSWARTYPTNPESVPEFSIVWADGVTPTTLDTGTYYTVSVADSGAIVDTGILPNEERTTTVQFGNFDEPQCRDSVDNDQDGKIDFEGGDLGCTNADDNDETNPTPTGGGGGGNGQIVNSSPSAPGYTGGTGGTGGGGTTGGGTEGGSGGTSGGGGTGDTESGGTQGGGAGGNTVTLPGGTTITANETGNGGTELTLENPNGEPVTINSENPNAADQLAAAQASGVFGDVPDWAWILLLVLLLLGAGGYAFWDTIRRSFGA